MGTDASRPLQRAIFRRLDGDAKIRACLKDDAGRRGGGGGDGETSVARVLRVEGWTARAWHSATFDGQEHDIRIVATLPAGESVAGALNAAIVACLHDADLAIPGHALIELVFESSETRCDEASGRCQCRMRFRALTVSD